jgi:cell division septation protein DedD
MDVTIECICPAKADGERRHNKDTVTLKDTLNFRERLALRQTIKWAKETTEDITEGELLAILTEGYVLQCIEKWSLVDAKGKPLPPTRGVIRAFLEDHDDQAMAVADAADGLYSQVVLLPLLIASAKSSQATPTDEPRRGTSSTSPMNTGASRPRKPSKPSSTITSPMVVTGPMLASPGFDSSSSQN